MTQALPAPNASKPAAAGDGAAGAPPESVEKAEVEGNQQTASLREVNDWFVGVKESNGAFRYYTKEALATELRGDILEGKYAKDATVVVHAKTEGTWEMVTSVLEELATAHFNLRTLYQPIWSHAMAGLKWGALIGVGLKLLDSLILVGSIDPALALLFLVAIGVCFIPRVGLVGVVVISIFMAQLSDINFFMMGLTASLVGALLGCLPGMAIGGIIGYARRSSLETAHDAPPEPSGLVFKSVLLPLAGAIGLFAFYLLVVNPWIVSIF